MTSRETNSIEYITRGAKHVRISIVHESLDELAYQYRRDPSQMIAEQAITETVAEVPAIVEQPAAPTNAVTMAEYRTANNIDNAERARRLVSDSYGDFPTQNFDDIVNNKAA